MNIKIRKAGNKDIPSILSLSYELGRPKPSNDREVGIFKKKIKDYFVDPQKSIIVAIEDSKIVGFVSLIFLQRLNRAYFEMYIPELVVTGKKRSFGIGKKLIDFCIELAEKKDCYGIRLESGNMRKKSHQFYKNIGFEQTSLSFSKLIRRDCRF